MGKLTEATNTLDHLAALQETAALLAARIELSSESGAGTLAQEVAQYRATMAEIRSLPADAAVAPKGGGKVVSADDVRKRREARRAAAENQPPASKGNRQRG